MSSLPKTLVRSFLAIMIHERADGGPEVFLAEQCGAGPKSTSDRQGALRSRWKSSARTVSREDLNINSRKTYGVFSRHSPIALTYLRLSSPSVTKG
jgi:hypothetical protein